MSLRASFLFYLCVPNARMELYIHKVVKYNIILSVHQCERTWLTSTIVFFNIFPIFQRGLTKYIYSYIEFKN